MTSDATLSETDTGQPAAAVDESKSSFKDARRDRIVQAAREVFFEVGYANASMSMIAARVGGSKATLYAYFPGKEDLFEAIVTDQCGRFQSLTAEHIGTSDLRQSLTVLATQIIGAARSNSLISTFRLVVEESHRNPELARRFAAVMNGNGKNALTSLLKAAHDRGQIHAPDPSEALSVLKALWFRDLHMQKLLNLDVSETPEQFQRRIELAVDIFLAYYGRPANG